jgi:hypothetical protein
VVPPAREELVQLPDAAEPNRQPDRLRHSRA